MILARKLPQSARRWFNRYRFARQFASGRHSAPGPVPIATKLKLAWNGFFPDKYYFYNLKNNDWRAYLSDWHTLMVQSVNGDYSVILYDKILFEIVVGSKARVPRNFAYLNKGSTDWLVDLPAELQNVPALIRQEGKLILKPRNYSGGIRVHLLEYRNDSYWCDFVRIDLQALETLLNEATDAILVEFVRQGAFANRMYPNCVNTMRITTLLDPGNGEPFIIGAGLKIGCDKSAPRDNFYAGGLYCEVDFDTGRLARAWNPNPESLIFDWAERHPDTGVIFEEEVIPDWDGIRSDILDLAGKLPYLPLVAWDVALLDDGICLIEGNHWIDLSDHQFGGGLLADPRVRAFFEYHKLL